MQEEYNHRETMIAEDYVTLMSEPGWEDQAARTWIEEAEMESYSYFIDRYDFSDHDYELESHASESTDVSSRLDSQREGHEWDQIVQEIEDAELEEWCVRNSQEHP